MSPDAPVVSEDRHGRILAELAGMGLELARDLRERALAAETAEEATRLARAFQSISRGVRQTLALELKVARFRRELDRELEAARAAEAETQARAARVAADLRVAAVRRRRMAVAAQVERLIYSEDETESLDDDAFDEKTSRLQRRLNAWLETAAEDPGFTTADVGGQIVAACAAVGLDPSWLDDFDDERAGPEAEPEPEPDREPEPEAVDPGPPVHIESG